MGVIALGARAMSVAALLVTSIIALTFWLVRAGHLAPFGPWPRAVRRMANPLLHPLEGRLVRTGRNPQDAPLWLFGLTVLGGLLLISLVDWLVAVVFRVRMAAGGGGRGLAILAVNGAVSILILALVVRVVASWFGIGAYNRFFRPVILLTEWLVAPIRRLLPPMGMVDWSPLVAWLALLLLRSLLLGLLW
ncbi:MAG TPA: YggT family protein [Gemmatimonadales bacterium]|nr:YggT family protein [Gemmatimonadales bacterium]